MDAELWTLSFTAFSIGTVHTLLGPDHYVPFVAMSRAGGWSWRKTLVITLISGLGHVGSSVVLGALGLMMGLAIQRVEGLESARGDIAAWMLIGFGLMYLVWGVMHAARGRSHSHLHVHDDGTVHVHPHDHASDHLHAHERADGRQNLTPWILFTIFLFGPCEPLIPLLLYPAAEASWWGVVIVTLLFTVATLGTMTLMVGLLAGGFQLVRLDTFERYAHALAGAMVMLCGAAVKFGL
jgi:ABC-type nickel/cobalt efflux system permease component RcnA